MATKPNTKHFWGLGVDGWLASARSSSAKAAKATLHVCSGSAKMTSATGCPSWLWDDLVKNRREFVEWTDNDGIHCLIAPEAAPKREASGGLAIEGGFARFRDSVGLALAAVMDRDFRHFVVRNHMGGKSRADAERALGALVGLEVGHYRFRKVGKPLPKLQLDGFAGKQVLEAAHLGVATNMARHLVNLPPQDLNPQTYASSLKKLFQGSRTKVEVWTGKKLQTEKCEMLLAVGRGAVAGPCLIRLKYRPNGAKGKPIAFVGKGVTFDSGGLDIKPAAGMRLMKKDMGGSASVVGLAYWAERSAIKRPIDFYLACAENGVDAASFHPGDIIKSRKGLTVEIHNTDAEGRLVLGDALDVAATRTGADKPQLIIDLATLTGAMRVALGLRVAGMFSTDEVLAKELAQASQEMGDRIWRMPLVDDYEPLLSSTFADLVNSASVPFGGGITAALFLRRFVGDVPWAHIDMMGWSDKRFGALSEPGGNGQLVQALASYLQSSM